MNYIVWYVFGHVFIRHPCLLYPVIPNVLLELVVLAHRDQEECSEHDAEADQHHLKVRMMMRLGKRLMRLMVRMRARPTSLVYP